MPTGDVVFREIVVLSPGIEQEIWIPRSHLGDISSADEPVLIVGLTVECPAGHNESCRGNPSARFAESSQIDLDIVDPAFAYTPSEHVGQPAPSPTPRRWGLRSA